MNATPPSFVPVKSGHKGPEMTTFAVFALNSTDAKAAIYKKLPRTCAKISQRHIYEAEARDLKLFASNMTSNKRGDNTEIYGTF